MSQIGYKEYKDKLGYYKNQLYNWLQFNNYTMRPTKKFISVIFEDIGVCANIVDIKLSHFKNDTFQKVSFTINVINTKNNNSICFYEFKDVPNREVFEKIDKCLWQIRKDNAVKDEKLFKEIEKIAEKYFDLPTLKARNSDELDFFETSVWTVADALKAAYDLGYQKGMKEKK